MPRHLDKPLPPDPERLIALAADEIQKLHKVNERLLLDTQRLEAYNHVLMSELRLARQEGARQQTIVNTLSQSLNDMMGYVWVIGSNCKERIWDKPKV